VEHTEYKDPSPVETYNFIQVPDRPAAVDVEFFRRHGYVVVESLLAPNELRMLRAAYDELEQQAQSLTADTTHFQMSEPTAEGRRFINRISDPVAVHPAFHSALTLPRIGEVASTLLGTPNVKVHHTKVFVKPPYSEWCVEWHQDFSYFVHTNFDLLAIGIVLDDAGDDNGALRVIPGSHRSGPLVAPGSSWRLDLAAHVEGLEWTAPQLRAGDAVVHHCCTIHASGPNRTARPRRTFILQLAAGDNHQIAGRRDYAEFGTFVCGSDPRQVRLMAGQFPLPPPREATQRR
jgi:ectoine hydroxylase-related dioxygenase (phytanoyl-CoA dioxygenase family)